MSLHRQAHGRYVVDHTADTRQKFGNDLRNLIKRTGYNESEVARKIGVSPTSISRWVVATRMIPKGQLCAIVALSDDDPAAWLARRKAILAAELPTQRVDVSRLVTNALGLNEQLPTGASVRVIVEIHIP